MSTQPPTDSVGLGYYALAYFDLLGQQDRLRNLRVLPNRNDADEREKVRKALQDTYGAVLQMRKYFESSFASFGQSRVNIDLKGLTDQQRAEFQTWTNDPIKFYAFSDSFVAYIPLRTNDAAKLPVRGIFGILAAAALTFTCSLANGHPIRGGIDVGLGVEHGANEIYGPVLSRAYTLESRVADYPRIVVGDELIEYLSLLMQPQSPETPLAKLNAKIAERCLSCFATDTDGHVFIDHMGEFFHNLIKGQVDGAVVKLAIKKVAEFAEGFKQAKNSKLAFRYALLADYFEDRLPIWKDDLDKSPTVPHGASA